MALLGYEGFDYLSTVPGAVNDLANAEFGPGAHWNVPASPTSAFGKTAGLLGGFAITATAVVNTPVIVNLATDYTTLICGIRYKADRDGTNSVFQWQDNTGAVQCGISVSSLTGKIFFWRGTVATVLATGTEVLLNESWYMIEAKVTISNTVGEIEVRVDEVVDFSASGLDTQNTAIASVSRVSLMMGLVNQAYDDFYVCDTTGPAPYNDYLGTIRVETLYPTSNNSVTWTPLSGTNWQMVSQVSNDFDTTYNLQTATGIDTFGHGVLSSTPVDILGVALISCARKTDVKLMNYRNKLIVSGVTFDGATSGLATQYQYVRDDYLVNPNTTLAWTASDVNATLVGYERF